MPTFREAKRATTKGKEQRPWVRADKVKHPQFLPHLQFFRWVHLKNNPGKGKAVRPYQQSVADARLLRTAIRDRLSHWGNGDAPAGGWGADLLVEAPGWTKQFLAEVEPVEGQALPEDDDDGDDGDEGEAGDYMEEAGEGGILHGWGHEDEREEAELDEGASVGGGGSVALSALRPAEIAKRHEEKGKMLDALLESAEFKALSPADQAKRLLAYDALEEAWEGVAPARYEKGKEREVFDKKMATAVMKAWPMPKAGETHKSPAYVARLNAFLALPNPIPGYTAQDADRERLLPGGVKAINFIQGGGKKSNEMLRREDETPAEFAIRQKALKVPWGGARAIGAYKGESQATYIGRIKAGWRAKNADESDADFIKAFEEAKSSTTITYPQGVGNLKQFLFNQTDAEGSADYYLDLERGKRDLQRGKSTRYGEKVSPDETETQFKERKSKSKADLRSSHFPFVGKNPFEELKEGRGDLAYDVGRYETDPATGRRKLVGSKQLPVGSKYLLQTPIGHNRPWSDTAQDAMTEDAEPHPVPVRRKRDGKTEFYVGKVWKELNAKEFDDLVAKPALDSVDKQIADLETSIEVVREDGEENPDYELLETDELLLEKLKSGDLKAKLRKLKSAVGLVRKLGGVKPPVPAPAEAKEAEPEPEAEDEEAGELVDILQKDDEQVYNAYQAHLASQSKPVVGDKPLFFERMNELMNRHAMGLEDVSAGLERLKEYKAGGKKGKQPMEHAFADPGRPGSLAKLKVAKGAGDDGVGLVSNREGAKKVITTMAKEGQIAENPNKGLAKAGQRGKLMWRPPTVRGEPPAEAVEVPEGEIFPIRLSSSEKFQQAGKDLDQWKTYGEGKDGGGHLPATARAFIDPINKDMMRIYAFDPPREIAQGEKDPEDPTGWRVRKIDPQFLPAVKGGSMKIEPGRPVGRPYRDIDARLATLTEEREAMIERWAEFPEWLRDAFPGRYAPTMEGRVIGGGFGEGQGGTAEQRAGEFLPGGRWGGAEGTNALGMFPGQSASHFTKPGYGGAGIYKQGGDWGIGQRVGRAERMANPPRWNPRFLEREGITQEEADAMFQEMRTIYFRDEDIGSEFDRLKLTGDSRGSLGGEAWGRAGGRGNHWGQAVNAHLKDERATKATLAELRGKPLRERAEALSELTEEEKAGKTPEQIGEAQRSKTARVLRELQKRGLLPPPGATRASGAGGDLEWATSRQLGINQSVIEADLVKKKQDEWLKAHPGQKYAPYAFGRDEAKAEALAMVEARKAELRKGEGLAFPPPLKKKAEAPKAGGGGEAKPPTAVGLGRAINRMKHPWMKEGEVSDRNAQRAEDAWHQEHEDDVQHSRPVFDKEGGRLSDAQVRVSRDGRWERYDHAGEGKRAWQNAFSSYKTGGGYDHIYDLVGEDKKNGLEVGKKYKDLLSSPHDPEDGQWWLERVFTSDRPVPNMERVGGEAILWVCEMEADGAGGATKVCRALPWCNPTLVKRIAEHNAKLAKGKPKARLPDEYREG